MKLDAHQHFWKYNRDEFAWIDDRMQILKRDFLPGNLLPELQAMQFQGSIAIQARQTPEETRWLLKLAEENDFIKAVVGWIDLCSNRIEEQLEEFTSFKKLCGVRHVIHDETDIDFMRRNDFRRGIGKLSKYGLTYDLLIFPEHLTRATELVREFPDQIFILDHIAKPLIKAHILEPWATDLAKLAGYPNVFCKLSGMVTEADWQNWKAADFQPYLEHVLRVFGADRLMIGSDWPVCTVAGNYRDTLSLVTDFIAGLNPEDRARILGGNCRTVYQLDHLNP